MVDLKYSIEKDSASSQIYGGLDSQAQPNRNKGPKAAFYNLGPVDIWSQINLCCSGPSCTCSVTISLWPAPSLYSLVPYHHFSADYAFELPYLYQISDASDYETMGLCQLVNLHH
ncbi:uncharacterized protein LOC113916432 [Zalophus californianus]|uniref:Uncharacterized protein LOC113916432 n=1 Tax=Zalophus californianus TaxID=9704 RepID=A0A6P9FKB2_ZALCA|nr:uncharacterized protein LOC113916432 [Zalophus californianus]